MAGFFFAVNASHAVCKNEHQYIHPFLLRVQKKRIKEKDTFPNEFLNIVQNHSKNNALLRN
jgi:hypothetical protein